jgi:hypothetical protein
LAEVEEETEEMPEEGEDAEGKEAMAVDRRRGATMGNSREAGPSRPDWPGGKTINSYSFARDDSRVSLCPPNGECYICTSPKHVAWDCSHYGRWQTLRQAMLIHIELDPEEEEAECREYVAMLVESKISSSTYLEDAVEPNFMNKNILVVDTLDCGAKAAHVEYQGFNRNCRQHDAFVKEKSTRTKGKQ